MRYLLVSIVFLAIVYSCTKDKGLIPVEEVSTSTNPGDTACSSNISYSLHISPITSSKCALPACHGGPTYPNLTNYANFKSYLDASAGTTLKSYVSSGNMPQGGPKLSDCEIKKFYAWVDAGYPNN